MKFDNHNSKNIREFSEGYDVASRQRWAGYLLWYLIPFQFLTYNLNIVSTIFVAVSWLKLSLQIWHSVAGFWKNIVALNKELHFYQQQNFLKNKFFPPTNNNMLPHFKFQMQFKVLCSVELFCLDRLCAKFDFDHSFLIVYGEIL